MLVRFCMSCLLLSGHIVLVAGQAGTATFLGWSYLPGSDNLLNTSDDISISLPLNTGVHFTDELAHLVTGVGVLVDSSAVFNGMELPGIGGIVNFSSSGNVLVSARPDVSPTAFSFAANRIRFVDPITSAPKAVNNVSILIGLDHNHTVRFFDVNGNVLSQQPAGSNDTISLHAPGQIAYLEVTTDFSVYTDNLVFNYVCDFNRDGHCKVDDLNMLLTARSDCRGSLRHSRQYRPV